MHTLLSRREEKKRKEKKRTVCFFKMVKNGGNGNPAVKSEASHKCSVSCLGPLIFHCQAVGNKVRLSRGGLLAERKGRTFQNGLVFSSRPLKIQERIRLRVEKQLINWHGALRVGFTNVSPSDRSRPLPAMAIPNLTDTPGHWAAAVDESYCQEGTELEFWVSHGGSIYVTSTSTGQQKLLTGVDLSKPLWAMIDIYGQTCSISLLGSQKKELLYTRRSCPAPECLTSRDADYSYSLIPDGDSDDCMSLLYMEVPADTGSAMDCVVCMGREASITLPCGHRCLCRPCGSRVIQQFGSCPLCRQEIRAPSVEERQVSGLLQASW
ncbi:E3 ubiquitin-protein ligase NEURL3 [Sparus aurata]|uniref:E3 ubiquitin-protein ligase NEURL3-like n=1 Tax=Sparus aurata TaxID=8175 RepID=A0A671U467_SPAAU|nr:E3 ubiquitin-protein ligase NEURL3-like [Sparus aurata]